MTTTLELIDEMVPSTVDDPTWTSVMLYRIRRLTSTYPLPQNPTPYPKG